VGGLGLIGLSLGAVSGGACCELRNGTSDRVKLRLNDCQLIGKVRYLIIHART